MFLEEVMSSHPTLCLENVISLVTCLGVEWAEASGTEGVGSPGSVVMVMDL